MPSAARKLRYNFAFTEGHGKELYSLVQLTDCSCFTHWPLTHAHASVGGPYGRAMAAAAEAVKASAPCQSCSVGHLGAVQLQVRAVMTDPKHYACLACDVQLQHPMLVCP